MFIADHGAEVVALLRLCWWFRTVALEQPPWTTLVCLETSELIKNGFRQVGFELNRQCFVSGDPRVKLLIKVVSEFVWLNSLKFQPKIRPVQLSVFFFFSFFFYLFIKNTLPA